MAGELRLADDDTGKGDCMFLTMGSFLFFTSLVGYLTWWITRKADHSTSQGYFLAGRSLTFPLIAGSLLLTNLSTEQMVGLNGDAFSNGLCVMVWEVVSVISMVAMAWFFLPRLLKSGVATVPQYLRMRFDHQTEVITNVIFLTAYVGILLPMILFTGAQGMLDILDVPAMLNMERNTALVVIVWAVGVIGSMYALWGGLRTVAVSDTLNGIGLLVGGFLITYFALSMLGGETGVGGGLQRLYVEQEERFNSIGAPDSSAPFGAVFSGIFLLTLFYWSTNQQIIQRTLGARSLAEGQKGVLLTGALKLLGPLYLVLPGMIAYTMFAGEGIQGNEAYGKLVNHVLPDWLTGFFAAVMLGAILSSFNSALNSSCTLFSLGIYKNHKPDASDAQVVGSGRVFGVIVALAAMLIAPRLAGQTNIFAYLQKMNGMYFIPILSVVLVGMISKRLRAFGAKLGLTLGFVVIAVGYFVWPFNQIVAAMHEFYFLGTVFAWLVIMMFVMGEVRPRKTEWVQTDAQAVDMTPWKYSRAAGIALIVIVIAIYVTFADFGANPYFASN